MPFAVQDFMGVVGGGCLSTGVQVSMDPEFNSEIKLAFEQNRCFPFKTDAVVVEALASGGEPEAHGARLIEIRDAMIAEAAGGDEAIARRLRNDARLRTRLLDALMLMHLALARAAHDGLNTRRFVLVRERGGMPALVRRGKDEVAVSHVGKGPRWAEQPSVYLGLSVFDLLADERRSGREEWFDAFLSLLLVEERAIETGYESVEPPGPEVAEQMEGLVRQVLQVASPRPEEPVEAADRRKPGRFTDTLRRRYEARLDARLPQDDSRFFAAENVKAVRALERLARRYRREGDQESLAQVVRLLVAASGHDVHEVRNRASVLLERIIAPKEFDAPLATSFVNVMRDCAHHFEFALPRRRAGYVLRLYENAFSGEFPTDGEIRYVDVELEYSAERGLYGCTRTFATHGHLDFVVMRRYRAGLRWVRREDCSGRVNVVDDVRGELILEIFTDIHGHTRMWWGDGSGHPGMVYNENGEIIRLGTFADVAAHLGDLKKRYGVTALYLLGVQRRGANREDWAPEATSPSPFSPMSMTGIEPALGGEEELARLVERAHQLDIKIIVDLVPHLNRRSTELPDDCVVKCLDGSGNLVDRASTDGRYGSWNDGKLLNWRKLEVWNWLRDSVLTLVERFGIDGVRFDIAHAVPIMMKRENSPVVAGRRRDHGEMLRGNIISNEMDDDHLRTTGFYDSACRDAIAPPLHQFLMQAVERKLRQVGKKGFLNIAECYWGHERFLARCGILPYNSALFKICESISRGKGDVGGIYNLYENHYANVLPPGTTMVGILGNHDERRALNTFGHRGLRPAVALTVFMSDVVLDYEGSAEGEGWKVYLDNIHVDWNEFEWASHRSLQDFYAQWYGLHRTSTGSSRLLRTDNPMVAAAMKQFEDGLWVGVFSFVDVNQGATLRFDDPQLPIEDGEWYRMVDAIYSPVTGQHGFFTGRELRASRVSTVVPYTDRVKLLRLELVQDHEEFWPDMMRNSFFRLRECDDPDSFPSRFAFEEIARHATGYDALSRFLQDRLLPIFGPDEMSYVEGGLKRVLFHLVRLGHVRGDRVLGWIRKMAAQHATPLSRLGETLQFHNRRGPMVFLSAEAEPFSKSGGLANVVYELPREMAAMGEKVTVITPMYRQGHEKAVTKMQKALQKHGARYTGRNVRFWIRDQECEVGVHEAMVDGVRYLLVDHHELFDGLYWGYTAVEKLRRRVGFARACIEVIDAFDLQPQYVFTNDAYAGLFNGMVRSDPEVCERPCFVDVTYLHIIHNGGWQYFDTYHRWENGFDLFSLFNLPADRVGGFTDPHHPERLNCMATSIRHADRVFTVSPSYARQIQLTCDGLEVILNDVVGISNAVGRDLGKRLQETFDESGFVEILYPQLVRRLDLDARLRETVQGRWPEILAGPRQCERVDDPVHRGEATRARNKMLLQIERGFTVDPDRVMFTMIHRITEQKGFSLLLEASEGIVRHMGYQGIVGGAYSMGDEMGERLADGLAQLQRYYPRSVSFHPGYQDVSIPLLSTDVFLMPSMNEPGGISQLEAFACGCLVVARATGGLRDTVTPVRVREGRVEGNGFLFVDFTPAAFHDAMRRCAEFLQNADETMLRQARQNAWAGVYNWDRPARRYIDSVYSMREVIRP